MNNEEKILSLLETLVGKVSALETDVGGLKTDVAGLKTTQELHTRKLNKLEAALEFQARKLSMIEMVSQKQLELLIRMSDNQDELDRRVSQLEGGLV